MRYFVAALILALTTPSDAIAESHVVTADPQINAMYALAQKEIAQNEVKAIRDWGYRNEQPIPCNCFETGEKWHFVWTRDLSYAADLALARTHPDVVRNSLEYKESKFRSDGSAQRVIAQDTGSGGSWPISSDRVVWFLAAKHLAGKGFLKQPTLAATLAQDREYVFDRHMGLYRGETSFLDWREQTYPKWTADNVTFIGESFALSTNVLHYLALKQAGIAYDREAEALKRRIAEVFWDRKSETLRSVVGPAYAPIPLASQDLLGVSLAVIAEVIPADQAKKALGNYPVASLGSPVVWPQQPDIPIYHNRAMWPFVSAYALRAARKTGDVTRAAFEFQSILGGADQNGSNMENYEIATRAAHVEDGKLSGPVVNSPRQLWSVAGMIMAVEEGLFGLEMDGHVKPWIPVEIARRAFGDRQSIEIVRDGFTTRLLRPKGRARGNVWVADVRSAVPADNVEEIQLKAIQFDASRLRSNGTVFAPKALDKLTMDGSRSQRLELPNGTRLYRNGVLVASGQPYFEYVPSHVLQCFQLTRVDAGIESLPSEAQCFGSNSQVTKLDGSPVALAAGTYRIVMRYENNNGPINTGITAAVKKLQSRCGTDVVSNPIVMPHSVREQDSTSVILDLKRDAQCRFALEDGVNMSDLQINAEYTGGKGGVDGRLNEADYRDIVITPLDRASLPMIDQANRNE